MYCIIVVLLYLINPNLFVFDGVLGASWNFGLTLMFGEVASIVLWAISDLGLMEPNDEEALPCYFNFKLYKEICNSCQIQIWFIRITYFFI